LSDNEFFSVTHSGSLDGEFNLYRQVEVTRRDQIADGQLGAGDQLPAEELMCTQFGESRGALRQALGGLDRDFNAALPCLGTVTFAQLRVEAILADQRFAMLLNLSLGTALLSVWWVDLLNGARAICSQMILLCSSFALHLKPQGETC